MRVFVTGASGWVGSAVVPELIGAGHQVVGLARSATSAAALEAAGAQVRRGSLEDLESLRAGAAASDGVIHLAYNHDFSDIPGAAQLDRRAIETLGGVLEGSERPLVIASGTLGLAAGRPGTEEDWPHVGPGGHPRIANALVAMDFAARGVRTSVVRLSPSVHGRGDHGFIPILIGIARDKGASAYVDDGASRWTAVHRLDAAQLFRLAVEQAPARSVLHAVADEGVPTREIAEVIGRQLDLPVISVPAESAAEHFGFMGLFFGMDSPATSALTRERFGWQPTQPGLIADLEAGHYFQVPVG